MSQLDQRQYRQQFLEAKMSEHKSWVYNDVYYLVDMRKPPPKHFVKGRWVLTVKQRQIRKVSQMYGPLGPKGFSGQTKA